MFMFRRGSKRVTAQQAAERTGAEGDAVLLDVREQQEGQVGHAPHAVHLPLTMPAAGAALPDAAQGRRLVVICRSGGRSRRAAVPLGGRGADVVDVAGGMQAWAAAGLPVVERRGRPGSTA
ncbi:rhodanese-like domain-containing protein [Streptomyces bobili]|uniref:rhodanese-like domain-containing protein n=1 Tax=Streptomyces bobili TaxID=67280 RepID=UPI0033A26E39